MLRTAIYSLAFILSGLAIYSVFNSQEAVSGSVRFDDGETAPFAEISVYDRVSEELVFSTVADENGQFSFTDLKPGSYNIELGYTGFQTQERTVDVASGDKEDLGDIKLTSLFSDDQYTIKPKKRTVLGS